MEKRKRTNKKYSPQFKISVILDMLEHGLSCRETVRKYWQTKTRAEEDNHRSKIKSWERIYLEEGAKGFMVEKRGKNSMGRPRKKPLSAKVENNLIAENQRLKEQNERLRMENEYLKKLDALVRKEEREKNKRQK